MRETPSSSHFSEPVTTPALRSWRSLTASAKVHLTVLILLGIAAYRNSLDVPFVFDDFHAVVGNPAFDDLSKFLEPSLFTRPRFIVDLTFALQWHWHPNKVLPFHLVNLFIHGVNAALAYGLTTTLLVRTLNPKDPTPPPLTTGSWPAFVAAAVFLLHPLQTQAVTYIVQRYTAFMACFYLGAVWAFVIFRQNGRPFWGILSCLLACGAFLCKQTGVTLPLSLLAIEGLFFTDQRRFWTQHGPWLVAPAVAALMGILWNIGLLSETSWSFRGLLAHADRLSRETSMVSRTSYFFTQLQVLCRYMGLIVLPLGQCVDHRYPFVHRFWEGWTPLAAAWLLVSLSAAWFLRRRAPLVSLGVYWFFITLSVESSFIPIRDAMFEHRVYLALLGFGWILAWALQRTPSPLKKIASLGVCLFLAVLFFATGQRNEVWRNPVTLWREAVGCNPKNFRAYNNLGRHLMDGGQLEEAYGALVRALELNPFSPDVYFNLGILYARKNAWEQALARFSTALSLSPREPVFYYQIGLAYHRLGLAPKAREAYQAALLHRPEMEGPALNLAALAFGEGQYTEARHILESLIRRSRTGFKPYFYLATVLRAQGHPQEALAAVQQALRADPENTEGLFLQALLLMDTGRTQEAFSLFHRLKNRHPNDNRFSFWLDKLCAPGAQETR